MRVIWHLIYWVVTSMVLIVGTLLFPFLRFWRNRDWLWQRLWPKPLTIQPKAWLHAVSLGEAVILNSVLSRFSEEERATFLLTSSTQTGLETLRRQAVCQCRLMPFDHPLSLRRFFKNVRVPNLVIVETEIWPELYRFVSGSGGRILLINARLSRKTLKWSENALMRASVAHIDRALLRSESERAGFKAFGLPDNRMAVTGNIKFDYVNPQLKSSRLRVWLESTSAMLFIFSSISDDEIELLAPQALLLLEQFEGSRLLWVPRHFGHLERHQEALESVSPVLRDGEGELDSRCVILNTIGELSSVYPYGTLSVIGGSFNQRGGQNFLESLAAGVPALVGPCMHNFKLELDLALEKEAIIQVQTAEELNSVIRLLLEKPSTYERMQQSARELIQDNLGATEKTVAALSNFLKLKRSIQR